MTERVGRILRDAGVAEAILPANLLTAVLAAEAAIDEQGYVRPRALQTALRQTAALDITGTATVVQNAALPRRIPQTAVKVRIDAYALTPPSGGPFQATVYADNEPIGTVTIDEGQHASPGDSTIAPMPAGAWITCDVDVANSAADIAIEVTYRVNA